MRTSRFAITTIVVSLAVLIALVVLTRSLPRQAAVSAPGGQAAGQVMNENFLEGGSLQRALTGNEVPQEFITVETGPEMPQYLNHDYTVRAGKIIGVTLRNESQMNQIHDWVLVQPGTLARAEAEATSPNWGWIPAGSEVLAFVPMTEPGQSTTRLFRAPAEPGDYPFLCSYPGHASAMNGIVHVVQ